MIASLKGRSLILGSGSSSRQKILKSYNIAFNVFSANINEKAIGDRSNCLNAKELVTEIASAKNINIVHSLMLSNQHQSIPPTLLLTADTVITHHNHILEKPINSVEAKTFLRGYCSSSCSAVTALVLTDLSNGHTVKVRK